jgi:hypothetical protein
MAKYRLKIPDVNKISILLSGAKVDEETFKVAAVIKLKNHDVYESTIPEYYPETEWFPTMKDMFDMASYHRICNHHGGYKIDFSNRFCFKYGDGECVVFSKHKRGDAWIVKIYDPSDKLIQSAVNALIKREMFTYEFLV